MASVTTSSTGSRRIQFRGFDNLRKTIHLGKTPIKSAETICRHIEALLTAKIGGVPLPRDTASWLSEIADSLRDKLVKLELVEPRTPTALVTVGSLVADYLQARSDVKAGTRVNLDQSGRALIAYLGTDRPITEVTEADGENFARQLTADGLAHNTARRRTGRAKQFFAYAVRKRIISTNPFNGVKTATGGNPDRQEYVPVGTIEAVLDACPSVEWRLIVALSRFAGLRCPSEHLGLTWGDIHWDTGRFTVRSPKTEHIEGKAERIVPIFPELYPYLRDAFESAEPGQVHVITRNRCEAGMANGLTTNWRTQFMRIIKKAGVKTWPRLFHGLRASCQTDLANNFPGHVVCEWLGNSLAVAREHYLQVTDDHYRKATQNPTHIPTQPTANSIGLHGTGRSGIREKQGKCLSLSTLVPSCPNDLMTLSGLEQITKSAGNCNISEMCDAFSDALSPLDPDLARLVALWPTLSVSDKAGIRALVGSLKPDGN